jgi:hypothetical protein
METLEQKYIKTQDVKIFTLINRIEVSFPESKVRKFAANIFIENNLHDSFETKTFFIVFYFQICYLVILISLR